jgi:glycosyltransferase involved in cell wall biosynthesis
LLEPTHLSDLPTVSIIVPTHSRPQFLRRAIESAFNSGTDVEVIVVDDASHDDTATVCKTIPGIVYVRLEKNLGVAGARNAGIRASSAPFISFLDDDDLRYPGSIDRQLELLKADHSQNRNAVASGAGMVYAQAIPVNQQGHAAGAAYPPIESTRDLFWDLLGQNFIPCGSVVFRRSCLNEVGPLNNDIAGIDDWDLWIRIAERFSVIGMDGPVLQWRRSDPNSQQGTSAASSIVSKSVRQFRDDWSKLDRVKSASADLRKDAWKRFSTNMTAHLLWEAGRALKLRNYRQALKNICASLQLGPMALVRVVKRYFSLRSLRNFSTAMQSTSCNYSNSWSDTKL